MTTLFPRARALAACALMAAALAGCAASGVNRGDLNVISLQEEWQLGRQIERQLAGQLKLVNDPVMLGYVRQVGQKIVQQTEMANLPWTFHVVADPAINAFNTPGGHIYVNTGLLAKAENAAELAGVMAHEVSHGISRHGTERLSKSYGFNLGAGLLLGQNSSALEQMAAQVVGAGSFAKFSRADEREADKLGVRYMYAAGYNPDGMATMFQKLMGERSSRPGSVEKFFSTHPLTEERIANVRAEAKKLPRKPNLATNDAGFSKARQAASRYGR